MSVTRRSSVTNVAFAVGRALWRQRIKAVLTGGACATLHSKGACIWSLAEGAADKLGEFEAELKRARRRAGTSSTRPGMAAS